MILGSKECESCRRLWHEYAISSLAEARLARELEVEFQAVNPRKVRSLTAELDSVLVFKAAVRSSIRSHAADAHLPERLVNHAPVVARPTVPRNGSVIESASCDLEQLRSHLRKMDDCGLRRLAKAAERMASPQAISGESYSREVFRLQLEEVRAEWHRRHPAYPD
jgi:hypothetical protein